MMVPAAAAASKAQPQIRPTQPAATFGVVATLVPASVSVTLVTTGAA